MCLAFFLKYSVTTAETHEWPIGNSHMYNPEVSGSQCSMGPSPISGRRELMVKFVFVSDSLESSRLMSSHFIHNDGPIHRHISYFPSFLILYMIWPGYFHLTSFHVTYSFQLLSVLLLNTYIEILIVGILYFGSTISVEILTMVSSSLLNSPFCHFLCAIY